VPVAVIITYSLLLVYRSVIGPTLLDLNSRSTHGIGLQNPFLIKGWFVVGLATWTPGRFACCRSAGHDQVIRFHTLKGLPVHRESCALANRVLGKSAGFCPMGFDWEKSQLQLVFLLLQPCGCNKYWDHVTCLFASILSKWVCLKIPHFLRLMVNFPIDIANWRCLSARAAAMFQWHLA